MNTGWTDYSAYWAHHWETLPVSRFVTDMDQQTYTRYMLDVYMSYPTHVETVYDLGCGTGMLVPTVVALWPGCYYYGFDICAGAIDYCREVYPALNWVHMTAPELPGKADLILCLSVFTHISQADTEHYLDVIHEALNDGGRASLSIHIDCGEGVTGSIPRVDYEPAYFESLLDKHGFEVISFNDKRQRIYEAAKKC